MCWKDKIFENKLEARDDIVIFLTDKFGSSDAKLFAELIENYVRKSISVSNLIRNEIDSDKM